MNKPILAPSLLAGDHGALAEAAATVSGLGLAWLHLDIMDGHFVPNLSFGPETLAALRRHGSTLFFDTHLMLSEPH
ncbi:MAG TPA: ribulose-phosphate 3-epimerase, partial [Opitutaceae bacterium]|nr:ribulose-phosphate 3-epimerase [Opitutaceae bacterium]